MEPDTEKEKPTAAQSAWALVAIIVVVFAACAAMGLLIQTAVNGLSFTDAEITWHDGFAMTLLFWLASRVWNWGNG